MFVRRRTSSMTDRDGSHLHTDSEPSIRAVHFSRAGSGAIKPLLTARQRRQLAAIATRVSVPARAIVYREDAPLSSIFVSSEGVLKAFRELPSGRRRVAAFIFGGDVFGLAENGQYVNTVQAVTKSTFYRIPNELLADLLRRDPDLEFQFLCKLAHELRKHQRHAIVLGRRDAPGRLAMFLKMLERNASGGTKNVIPLPMTRTDMAEYLSLSLESVSRAAATLARRGLVAFKGSRSATILDRSRFERLVTAV